MSKTIAIPFGTGGFQFAGLTIMTKRISFSVPKGEVFRELLKERNINHRVHVHTFKGISTVPWENVSTVSQRSAPPSTRKPLMAFEFAWVGEHDAKTREDLTYIYHVCRALKVDQYPCRTKVLGYMAIDKLLDNPNNTEGATHEFLDFLSKVDDYHKELKEQTWDGSPAKVFNPQSIPVPSGVQVHEIQI